MATKNMLLTGLIEDILYDIYPKTSAEMVFLDDTTTVAAKIAEMIEAINLRAKTTDVNTLINNLRQEMLGDTPVEAYNTFTELAAYIAEHEEVADALNEAIGKKANTADLGTLASKSTVTESDLDSSLKEKVNAASEGNHSHNNKTVLDGITASDVSNWNSAASKGHIFVGGTTQPAGMSNGDVWFKEITN